MTASHYATDILVNTGPLTGDAVPKLIPKLSLGESLPLCDLNTYSHTDTQLFPLGVSEAHYILNRELFEVATLVKFITLNSW